MPQSGDEKLHPAGPCESHACGWLAQAPKRLLEFDGAAAEDSALSERMNQMAGAVLGGVSRGLSMGLVYKCNPPR